MTPKEAAAEDDDFMAHAGKVLDAAVKLKAVMKSKGLKIAKAKCPMCDTGHLHGRLVGAKDHMRMWCDGCSAQMME